MNNLAVILLSAGIGSRLGTLSDIWPKCLMPIKGIPLLDFWLSSLINLNFKDILVNTHHHAAEVRNFINRPIYKNYVTESFEKQLLGTAGTIRNNINYINGRSLLLIHADNWYEGNLLDFINYHFNSRPVNCVMTMMTFKCDNSRDCGVVELDDNRIMVDFHEKVVNHPSKIANAAIYILGPEVCNFIYNNTSIVNFSEDVIPKFKGKIATWHNSGKVVDIGSPSRLINLNNNVNVDSHYYISDVWSQNFLFHPIHKKLIDSIDFKENS
jgi:mannose-1-phosphate guanylyltransferase